jgi:hypothetical protein
MQISKFEFESFAVTNPFCVEFDDGIEVGLMTDV